MYLEIGEKTRDISVNLPISKLLNRLR